MQQINKHFSLRLIVYFFIPILILSLLFSNVPSSAVEITDIEFIGEATIPTGTTLKNTAVGGLSGIAYDDIGQIYYAISDDRSEKAPARLTTLKIDLSQEVLKESGAAPVGVTFLLDKDNQNFARGTIDPEGIALTGRGTAFISSEGDAGKLINPFVKEFSLASGQEIVSLPIPDRFLPSSGGDRGIRNNLAFESLTITPDKKRLFTATENALIQDGSEAKSGISTNCRILEYNLSNNQLEKEYLYQTEAIKPLINLTGRYAQGLTDLLAIDNQGHFLSIERAFTGLGFAVSLFQVSLEGATNIHDTDSLLSLETNKVTPVRKKLLLDLRKLDVLLDNIEGLTFGQPLSNGQPTLILVSDNNFQKIQRTQFLAFKLKTKSPSLLQQLLRGITPR
ncbi:MAG: esterase-like activity of phytase family protein [Calothrix sp. C42_A2020_038]|nr:esterase-like activity of phytase family protein [Calothrix sp. C42_A2020_038]